MFIKEKSMPETPMKLVLQAPLRMCTNPIIQKLAQDLGRQSMGKINVNKKSAQVNINSNRKQINAKQSDKNQKNLGNQKKNTQLQLERKKSTQSTPKITLSNKSSLVPKNLLIPKKPQKEINTKPGTTEIFQKNSQQKTSLQKTNSKNTDNKNVSSKNNPSKNFQQNKKSSNSEFKDLKLILLELRGKVNKMETLINHIYTVLHKSKRTDDILSGICDIFHYVKNTKKSEKNCAMENNKNKTEDNFNNKECRKSFQNLMLKLTKDFKDTTDTINPKVSNSETDHATNMKIEEIEEENYLKNSPLLSSHSEVMKQVFKNHSKLIEQIAKTQPENFAEIMADISSAPPEIIEQILINHSKITKQTLTNSSEIINETVKIPQNIHDILIFPLITVNDTKQITTNSEKINGESMSSQNIKNISGSSRIIKEISKSLQNINDIPNSSQNINGISMTSKNVSHISNPLNINSTIAKIGDEKSTCSQNINGKSTITKNVNESSKTSQNINETSTIIKNFNETSKTSQNVNRIFESTQNLNAISNSSNNINDTNTLTNSKNTIETPTVLKKYTKKINSKPTSSKIINETSAITKNMKEITIIVQKNNNLENINLASTKAQDTQILMNPKKDNKMLNNSQNGYNKRNKSSNQEMLSPMNTHDDFCQTLINFQDVNKILYNSSPGNQMSKNQNIQQIHLSKISDSLENTDQNEDDIISSMSSTLPEITSETSLHSFQNIKPTFDVLSMKTLEIEEIVRGSPNIDDNSIKINILSDYYKPHKNIVNNKYLSNYFTMTSFDHEENVVSDILQDFETEVQNSLDKIEKTLINVMGKDFMIDKENQKKSFSLGELSTNNDTIGDIRQSSPDILQNNFHKDYYCRTSNKEEIIKPETRLSKKKISFKENDE